MNHNGLHHVVKAIEENTRAIKHLEKAIKPDKVKIHLAFMKPGDPKPTCWEKSGIGRKFTITNFPEIVNCRDCLRIMQENR